VPKYFINHGLGKIFEEAADKKCQMGFGKPIVNTGKVKVGYVGNLTLKYIDRELFLRVVRENPGIEFILIGPYMNGQSNLGGGDQASREFIDFLKRVPNAILTGPKGSQDLIDLLDTCDMFLICYSGKHPGYDLSNTHKMLEYLSMGKVLISSPIKAYEGFGDLIIMPETDMDQDFIDCFSRVVRNIAYFNSEELMRERIRVAKENTYPRQVKRIEEYLTSNNL
jgi:hypothetical protein